LTDEIGGELRELFVLAVCVSVLDQEILPLDVAEVAQPRAERVDRLLRIRAGVVPER
jgi:hypothetical protein